MREGRERIVRTLIPLLFLAVILGLYASGHAARHLEDCGPETAFSLDRGSYRVVADVTEPSAERYCVYYEVNGQERVLAQGSPAYEDGKCVFTMTLPANIRNDSVRVTYEAGGEILPQRTALRIDRILPTAQTLLFLAVCLTALGLLDRGFGGGRDACRLTGLAGAAFVPLYPVFCAAPGQTAALIALGAGLLFLADRRLHVPREDSVRYVFFLTLSLLALYYCTESSPFYVRNPWDDASIYYSIGRGITQGYVPYRDMFDHKGPIVFFVYAVGHLLTPDRFYGVYLLESLCFSGVVYFAYKTYRLYFENAAAEALAVISAVFLLNGGFLVYGGSCEEFTMVIYAAVLYGYLAYFSGKRECAPGWMFGAGALCGVSFWMKFNMTVCLLILAGMMMLRRLIERQKFLRHAAAFAGGGAAVSALVAGYFVCCDSIGYFKWSYFDANLAYADVKTIGETLAVFGKNVLSTIADTPGTSLVIAAGLLGFAFSSAYIVNMTGRVGLLAAFAALVGSTYVSYAYLYYYCLAAVFVIPGIVVIADTVKRAARRGRRTDEEAQKSAESDAEPRRSRWAGLREDASWYLALPCLCILLIFNQNYKEAAVFTENLSLNDVCELEVAHAGAGQTLLIYRNHRTQLMTFPDVRPAARYYFAPNISKYVPEINRMQDEYIHDGIADLVLVDHAEIYPMLEEWGLYQYEQILDWKRDGESVQLYRRRQRK